MTNRGDVLALAVALSGGEEVTLGPTDSAMCVEALKFYANAQRGERNLKIMRLPALAAAVFIGTAALGGSTAVVGNASSQMSMLELGESTPQIAGIVKGMFPPLPHISPESLAAQRLATAHPDES